MQILITNIIAVIGLIFIGWKLREFHARRQIDAMIDNIKENVIKEISTVKVSIEKTNGVFYLYNQDTDVFIAQGVTRKEVQDYLEKAFPNTKFHADPDNIKEIEFKGHLLIF